MSPFWRRAPRRAEGERVANDGVRRGVRRVFRLDVRSGARASAESDAELASYLEARTEDFIARGMTPQDARTEAIRRLGGAGIEDVRSTLQRSAAKRENRIQYGEWVDNLRTDLRVSLRALWRERGYSLVVALTVALGIGSAAATFAAFEHVLLHRLPVRDQDGLAVLTVQNTASIEPHVGITYGLLSELQAQHHAIKAVAGVPSALAAAPFAARDNDRVLQVALTATTGNFFEVLGTVPRRGRLLESADDIGANGAAAVLSYSAWQTMFGGRADIVGHEVLLSVGRLTIVGVAPQEFDYPRGTDIWVSDAEYLHLAGYQIGPEDGYWDALVRLKTHDGVDEAGQELMADIRQSTASVLGPVGTRHVVAHSFTDVIVGNQRDALALFAAAVALVLIVACTNVAGLLLARGLSRARDIAVRKALGATTRRIVGQLMVENLVLAVVGGILGVLAARFLLRALVALAPPDLARWDEVHLNLPVVGFALILTLLIAIAFGLVPALSAAGAKLETPLRSESRSQSASLHTVRVRQWLVISQVALAVVVLTSAGLLLRNLAQLQRLHLGFDTRHLLFVYVDQLDAAKGADESASAARHAAVIEGLVDRLKALPVVVDATPADAIPFSVVPGTAGLSVHYGLEGQSLSTGLASPTAGFTIASKDYFATLGISLIHGRLFTTSDRTGAEQVAIVSQGFADHAWPGRDPIGQRLRFLNDGTIGLWRTIVGVVADTRYHDFLAVHPDVYIPLYQSEPGAFIAVRTTGEPLAVVPLARDALRGLDQGYGIAKAVSAEELLATKLARPRFIAATVVVLAATVAILAAIGLFGVLSFSIRQRRQEFGVRLALGATATHLRSLVFFGVVRLTVIGVILGLTIGLPAARMLRPEIVGISIIDPISLFAVLAVMLTTIAMASALPVTRAAKVDPMSAIRE